MSNSTHRYRRGAKRVAGLVATASLVGAGAVATTGVAYAEEDTPAAKLESFNAADFADKAAALPSGLQSAIETDLGISPAEYLANAEATKSASDAAAALKADGVGVEGVSIDGQDVTIHVSGEADVAAAEAVGANVEIGAPESEDYSDAEFEPKADHKGGYGYAVDNGASIFRCSTGFSGYTPDGEDRFLTAGHCGLHPVTGEPLPSPVSHIELDEPIFESEDWAAEYPGLALGTLVDGSFKFGEGEDGGLVDLNGDWTGVPQVAGWAGGTGAPDEETVTVYDTIEAVEGAEACKSGATSGWTCGPIVDAEVQPDGYPVSGFMFQTCMLGGDSGGSVVVGNYALGVNSGSTWYQGDDPGDEFFASCDPALQPDDNPLLGIGYAVSGGEHNALDFLGDQWELNVEVNAPAIDEAGASEDGATLTGSVENAGDDHRVQVSVDEVGNFEADVNGDGEFTVDVDEALEVGAEYTYTATAHYGDYSSSAATEGSFTVSEEEPEPDVADLVVDAPSDGQTTSNPQPGFEGTGEPGADVTLTVGDEDFGAATVNDEGDWEITPESDLPGGVRFDATVTQVAGEDTQSVTVSDLGIELSDVTITVPEDGDEVSGDVVFEGTSFPGAQIGLQIEGTITEADAASDSTSFGAASEGFEAADEDKDMTTWEGDFEIDDEGNWTFTPDEALEDGEYTLTAMASLEGGDPELSTSETSVSFTVATSDGGGDEDGDEEGDEDGGDLPDTGSNNLPMILIGVGLLAAGGTALALRARRNASSNA